MPIINHCASAQIKKEGRTEVLLAPKKENYRKILGNLESKAAMNLKCGACASCTGGGGGKACKCTGVGRVEKTVTNA